VEEQPLVGHSLHYNQNSISQSITKIRQNTMLLNKQYKEKYNQIYETSIQTSLVQSVNNVRAYYQLSAIFEITLLHA